jgi:hypothetical protein
MQRYKEAIEHLLKALSIQEADSQLLQSTSTSFSPSAIIY